MAVTRLSNSGIKTGVLKYDSTLVGYPPAMPAPTAADGGTGSSATITFSAVSGATGYRAISSPGSFTGTGTSSPITVSGLSTGTAYTFQIQSQNALGYGGLSAASNSITPVVPGKYESIATAQPTSGTSVTFNSIPQTYKHLIIRAYINASAGGSSRLRFNGDASSANYSGQWGPYMIGSGPYADGFATSVYDGIPNQGVSSTTYGGVFLAEIQDYASTTKKKTVQSYYSYPNTNASSSFALGQVTGIWNNTGAITSLTITNGTFSAPTIIALYGIGA